MAVCASRAVPLSFGSSFSASDPLSGDYIKREEVLASGGVSGFHQMLDADGLIRTVGAAHPATGFATKVDRSSVMAFRSVGIAAPQLLSTVAVAQPGIAHVVQPDIAHVVQPVIAKSFALPAAIPQLMSVPSIGAPLAWTMRK